MKEIYGYLYTSYPLLTSIGEGAFKFGEEPLRVFLRFRYGPHGIPWPASPVFPLRISGSYSRCAVRSCCMSCCRRSGGRVCPRVVKGKMASPFYSKRVRHARTFPGGTLATLEADSLARSSVAVSRTCARCMLTWEAVCDLAITSSAARWESEIAKAAVGWYAFAVHHWTL